jgi:hypothetical protein
MTRSAAMNAAIKRALRTSCGKKQGDRAHSEASRMRDVLAGAEFSVETL